MNVNEVTVTSPLAVMQEGDFFAGAKAPLKSGHESPIATSTLARNQPGYRPQERNRGGQ